MDAFPSGIGIGRAVRSFKEGTFLEESLSVVVFEAVVVLESDLILSSSLSFEDEERASEEGFLKIEEAETLLEEYLAM